MKLIEIKKDNLIPPSEVKDGEICIVRVANDENIIEVILQKNGSMFIELGKHSGFNRSSLHKIIDGSTLVEVLPKGTILEI